MSAMLESGQTAAVKAAPTVTSESRVFKLSETPATHPAGGGEGWNFGGGALTTGEWVKLHETVQPSGVAHSPEHRIDHTELICIMSGEVEYFHDGTTERAAPGDIVLVARGTSHYLRNAGAGPARYFVLAIGGDVHA